ncbi:unnamed protein product, partial [Amoebophrya sp. A120]
VNYWGIDSARLFETKVDSENSTQRWALNAGIAHLCTRPGFRETSSYRNFDSNNPNGIDLTC